MVSLTKRRLLAAWCGLALIVGGVTTQAVATSCCQEFNDQCPPQSGPSGLKQLTCQYGYCCIGVGSNGAQYARCCYGGHCTFTESQNGELGAACDGIAPWPGGNDPW